MADQDLTTGGNDIAIIGMAGRFPGAADVQAFWRNLCEGVESIARLKPELLEASPLAPESVRSHPDFVPAASVLEEGESFDAGFFGVSPREAKWMDPQQRVFLECAWAALEDAAYDPERYAGKISLYAGAGPSLHTLSLLGQGQLDPASLFELMGTTGENLATKASFKLKLRGESLAVYTACSTGLVAVHMACQSLLLRQSDMAIAGAARLSLPQRSGYLFQDGMILSPDGHCRAFDAKAAGTVPGNGVTAVVLKPLEDALRDGDHVYAVIRGSALNNDGGLKVGYTAPSVEGQADVIGEALAYAGLEAGDIGYVEAHGTGTALGDPIEVAALTRAYRKQTDRKGYCGLGSVKTNIGHLDTAAGLAGLMKAALALHHEELPPSLNFERPNPAIDFANSPFFVVSERRPWPRGEVPRRAGVSSFGIGGTNAHAVLEEAPLPPPPAPSARPTQVVTLSARTATALAATARQLADWLEAASADVALADVAFTRNAGRRAFEHRRAVVAKDRAELLARLRAPGKPQVLEDVAAARERRVAFLLPGQGAQSVGMGRELYAAEPAFREALDACLTGLGSQLETAVRAVLLPAPGTEAAARETLADPRFALPALFSVEYALARLWESYGVKPYALLGHSFGEYTAACLAGVMPLEDALALVTARGRLMSRLPPGSMTAVGGAEEVVRPLLTGGLALAAVNGEERCVVSGPTPEVEAMERELVSRGVGVLRLPAVHAFHSVAVEPLMEELKRVVSGLRLSPPQVPYVSSVTGTWIRAEEATDPAYWARQMRAPVRFGDGLEALKADGCTVFLEVGPDQALTALARLGLRGHGGRAVASLPRAGAKAGEHAALSEALGALWEQGLDVRWQDVYAHEERRRLSLPTYPFERQHFGVELPKAVSAQVANTVPATALLVEEQRSAVPAAAVELPADKAGPRTDVERKVLDIWRERLGRADFGIHDDFLELGGNSLMAAQMLTRLREAFPVQLPLSDLFEAPTVAGVAARIQARLGTDGAEGTETALPPLVRIPRQGVLPLSVVQERVVALEQALPGNPALNMSMVLRMRGTLDVAVLERSLEAVTRRHESLRTSYPRVEGRTVLRVAPELKLPLTAEPVAGATPEAREAEWRRQVHAETARPLDIERGPVVRARLLRPEVDEHLLVVTVHHVVCDTWSLVVLGRELGALYGAFQQGQPSPLPELPVQYVDYAAWQRKALEVGAFASQMAAWRERLVSLPGALDLPVDRPRGDGPALSSLRRNVGFSRAMTGAVHALAQREGVTAYMVMLASWKALLARWAGRDDVVVGTPIGNRSRPELEPVMGYVAHAVPLRTDLSGDPSFRELLGRVRDVMLEAYAHPDVPYEHLVREVEPAKDTGRERVFDTLFVLHSRFEAHLDLPGLRMSVVEVHDGPAQFGGVLSSLSVSMGEGEDGFAGTLDYAEERFAPETMERLMAHWEALLSAAVADPDLRLSALPLEAGAARAATVPTVESPLLPAASQLEARAGKDAGAVVLSVGAQGVTWGELREKARRLAVELVARGVGPEVLVAVCLEPSVERVAALWAVLEAGGAYVLLSVPQLRELAALAPEGGAPPLLLTHERVQTSVTLDASRVLRVDTLLAEGTVPASPVRSPPVNVSAETMVCLESLVSPSGDRLRAVHTHRTVADLFRRLDAEGDTAGGAWLAVEEPHTPGSGLELLWALTRGLRVVLPPERARFNVLAAGNGLSRRGPDFSLSFFANDEDSLGGRKYRLLLEAAKFADANGFSAVWTPERHFHAFGGLYPRPAVVGAGVATVTERVGIRAGSVVLPLHDPVLVAEEWAVLDNLSDGRVGVSFASGWHANDFVFAPDRYARRKEVMLRGVQEVRTLWRGGSVLRKNGAGDEIEVSLRPRPVQKELPVWLTAAGSPETFRLAGEMGAYVLTNLMGQNLEDLAGKVALYREAWRQHGHAGRGHVSLMMHAYLGADPAEVRQRVRQPLLNYFRSSVDILAGFIASQGLKMDPRSLTPADVDTLLDHGVERYVEDGGLFGTPDSCGPVVEKVRGLDVDEVACLIDFGVEVEATLEGLRHLDTLRGRYSPEAGAPVPVPMLQEGPGAAEALLALVREAGVTHLHCTVAAAHALSALPEATEALRPVRRMWLEGATTDAAASLARAVSSEVLRRDAGLGLGAWLPLAGELHAPWEVVDTRGRPVPPGVVGELAVAGAGVPRGFWNAPGSSALRVLPASESGARRLATGRRARRRLDGSLELLGAVPAPSRRPKPPKVATVPAAKKPEGPPPIPRVPRDGPLPLSFAQQRLWYLDNLEPGNVAYNNAVMLIMSGALDRASLERALNEVVRRHEVLRTTFAMADSGSVQVILPSLEVPILPSVAEGASEDAVDAWAREEARRPFDLQTGPLIRARLMRVRDTEHVLLLVLHHIVSDGWSAGVMMHELARLYEAFIQGRPSPLPALPVQYADYSVWQQAWMHGPELKAEQDWWRDVLADVPVLRLPTDRPRSPVQTYPGARLPLTVPKKLAEALGAMGRREGATPFMVLMAAWQSLLHAHSGQEDFAVGTPVAGRNRPEVEPLIGCFINTIALRADLSGDPTFTELLGRVRRAALGGFAHQDVPFEKLVEALRVERDLSHTPIFQTMLTMHNTPAPELALADVRIRSRLAPTVATKVELTLDLVESREGLTGFIEYNTDLFDADTASRLGGHLLRLLEDVAVAPERRLSQLFVLSEAERERLLVTWNDTRTDFPDTATVHGLFQEQVERTPDALAVSMGDRRLTFRELDARANQLAHHLHGLGVRRGTLVGLCFHRSADMVVALWAVLKAGGVYVPIDPAWPASRVTFLLEDTGVPVLLTEEALADTLPVSAQYLLCLDTEWERTAGREPVTPPEPRATADDLAYLIYTSGSTGRPKGVMVEHRGVVNYLCWALRAYDIAGGGGSPVHSPLSFDLTVTSLIAPLVAGRPVVLVREEAGVEGLGEALRSGRDFSLVKLTPSHLKMLAQQLRPEEAAGRTRAFVIGGEALTAEDVAFWREHAPATRLINEYGPTETVVGCCVYTVDAADAARGPVAIGRPIANTRLYVLDAHLRLVPVGVPGELYIGGTGVTRGYWRRPELTAERFIPDAFSTEPGARLYRTGDRVRWLADGRLEYLGRTDFQVKVRGYRIELGEIEAVLRAHPLVGDAVAVVREDGPSGARLVAYVVPRDGEDSAAKPDVAALRAFLGERLPAYMVPATCVTLAALPRTRNGKVDVRAIPALERQALENQNAPPVAPRTEVEERLAALWREVLNVERVGIHDDFFELGGDSILSLQIVTRARAVGIELSPKQLFQHPTVARLAAVAGTRLAVQAEQGPVVGPVALTPIQRWFFELDVEAPQHWNMTLLLEVKMALDAALLERALAHVLEHHDALRLRFARAEDGWHQTSVAPGEPVTVERVDLSTVADDAWAAELEQQVEVLHQTLRLDGPLVKAALLDAGAGRPARLMLAVHHLVVDAVSWRILLEDLAAAYAQLATGTAVRLPPKTTSFQAWASGLETLARSEKLAAERTWWLERPWSEAARLPVDFADGVNTEATSRTVRVALDADETKALLHDVPKAWHTQPPDPLLTALAQALAKWTGRSAALVNVEGHGREEVLPGVDVSRTVGWFTRIFPALLDLRGAHSPGDALRRVKEGLRAVPSQGMGWGLLRYVARDASLAALPPAEVGFNHLGQVDGTVGAGAPFTLAPEGETLRQRAGSARRPHLLEVTSVVRDGRLEVTWSFSEALHRRETVVGVAEDFLARLKALVVASRAPEAGGHSPSDFPLAKVKQTQLDKLSARFGKKTR
ncbi:non-ribosomal peptide synthetase/type I polyketide synthase [Pyxidicoccus trucidator]|uniref:non-ribosomal peptide synthetase/type I polyketide synthase n=1 Tax=Pyxidicoccus trucidator TaxID=2709662 RepID=UPI0013DC8ED8|nr:non-ribosomal peptide synthetase/type I polyketide synthase [Pyxidicoccus trucidator]